MMILCLVHFKRIIVVWCVTKNQLGHDYFVYLYLSKSRVFPRQCGCKQSVLSEVRNRQHCNKMSTVTWYVGGSKVVLYITRRFT